jgi:outer membrane immunogenic protein
MSYVTGGLAYGRVELSGTGTVSSLFCGDPCPAPPNAPFSVTHAFDHSNVNTGWVVGTGTEGKLLIPGWTYKIEGLYMDLGHLDAAGSGVSPNVSFGVIANATSQVTTHTHFTDTILRVGLNYQFH